MADPMISEEEFPAQPKDKLILLVEDDESQLDLVRHLLSKEGFRLSEVSSGRAAMQKVKEQSPDLIVLDLMLPGLSGYELLRELQAAGFGDIPVVILTARVMDAKTVELVKSEPNVKEFFPKPPNVAFTMRLHSLLKTRPPQTAPPS